MKTVKLPAYFLKNIIVQTNNALSLGGVEYQLKDFLRKDEDDLDKFLSTKVPQYIARQINKVKDAAFDISWAHVRMLDDNLLGADHLKLNREEGLIEITEQGEDCGHEECQDTGSFESFLKTMLNKK